jgi:hypothetical protein
MQQILHHTCVLCCRMTLVARQQLSLLATAALLLSSSSRSSSATAGVVGDGRSSSSNRADMQQASDGAEAADQLTSAFVDWQYIVIYVVKTVRHTCQLLGFGNTAHPCTSSCSSNSSDSFGRVRWAYLLQLARSKKLAAAFDQMARAASHGGLPL